MSLRSQAKEQQLFKSKKKKLFSPSTRGETESAGKVPKKLPDPNERGVWNTGDNDKNQKLALKLCPSITMATTIPLCTAFGLEPGSFM